MRILRHRQLIHTRKNTGGRLYSERYTMPTMLRLLFLSAEKRERQVTYIVGATAPDFDLRRPDAIQVGGQARPAVTNCL